MKRIIGGRRPRLYVAGGVISALVLGQCLSSIGLSASGASGLSGGSLVIANIQPFSGADAAFGPEQQAGCLTAVAQINSHGGVFGKSFTCQVVDTKGDPVDAIPAVEKEIALTSNLVGAIGPSSDEASAIVPVLNTARIPMFSNSGQKEFDKSPYKYFYRILAADDAGGYAFAAWCKKAGYTRVAAVFGNTVSSQANVPTLIAGLKHYHIQLVINQRIAQGQSSYQTEATQLLAAKPQVIVTETDPQSEATYLANVKQLNNGTALPFVGPIPASQPDWTAAISGAIGSSTYAAMYRSVHPFSTTSGVAFSTYQSTLLKQSIPKPKQWLNDPYAQNPYDGVTIMALAMLAAHSTKPAIYNADIVKVTDPGSGKVVVHTFAQGKAALAAGHQIQYSGVFADVVFNAFHNSTSGFAVTKVGPNKTEVSVGFVSSADIATASSGG